MTRPQSAALVRSLIRKHIGLILLLAILVVAAYFRFTGLDWDGTYHLHPDERFLTDTASLLRPTDPITYLKTSESPLNPYNVGKTFYVYGNFPMTVTRLAAELADAVCGILGDACTQGFIYYDGIQVVGRFLSAAVDLLAIIFTFFIGRRLYDWRTGLLSALLLALAVLPIQQSHFFTMDNWAAVTAVLAMYAAVRLTEDGRKLRWWIIFGIMVGLSVASRVNMAPLAAMSVVAAFIWLARRDGEDSSASGWRYTLTSRGKSDVIAAIIGLSVAALFTAVTFRLAQPYAFADAEIVRETSLAETGDMPDPITLFIKSVIGLNPQWLANMEEIQNLQSPDATFPPALQWTDRAPILFPLTNMVIWGMGLAAGLAALAGFFWALWRIVRVRPDWTSHLLLVTWTGIYFIFMSTRWVKSIRYFLPIYPFLLLLGGWALIELWKRSADSRSWRAVSLALISLVTVSTFLWANAFLNIYRAPVSRVQASSWMFDNIPTGATLIFEVSDRGHDIQLPLRRFDFYPDGPPLQLDIAVPEAGVAEGIRFNYLSDLDGELANESAESLHVELTDLSSGEKLAERSISLDLNGERQEVTIDFPPIELSPAKRYMLLARAETGGAFSASTSVLANEHWDDSLPVRMDGRDPYSMYYDSLSEGLIPITHPDSEDKRTNLYRWLDESDYIVLSSQRALWSIPRLPLTYPLTARYYDALFGGELGFELIKEFHADLHIGPLYISDVGGEISWGKPPEIGWPPPGELAAEEAFSVYDHPPVWIFSKTDDYSSETVRQVLGEVDLSQTVFMTPGQATKAPSGLMLDPEIFQEQQEQGTFSDLFDLDGLLNQNPWLAGAAWWFATVLLGWLAFPITFVVFRGLDDRGYPLARILSLLIISYFGWLAASLQILPNSRTTLLLGLLIVAAASLLLAFSKRREMLSYIREKIYLIGLVEILGLIFFIVLIVIRLGNPDAWDVIWGGEKPMDLSYFNAVLKSSYFPPYDPWLAGGYINYYYYGFVFVGALTKLLGIMPTIAYNLILPMLFSFTALAVFSIAYNLAVRGNKESINKKTGTAENRLIAGVARIKKKAVAAGIAAAVLCVLLGNLAQVTVVLNTWREASDSTIETGSSALDTIIKTIDGGLDLTLTDRSAPIYPGDWFWLASRAINAEPGEVQPITEFPFFTFLYGDMHAHMIALPLTLLALAWAVSVALDSDRRRARTAGEVILLLFIGGLSIGVLRATNTWDFPTYLLIGVLSVLYAVYRRFERLSVRMVGQALLSALILVSVSILLFLPFTEYYGVAYESVSLWPGSYTHLSNYLIIYGLFLFLIVSFLVIEFRRWSQNWTQTSLEQWRPFTWPFIIFLFILVLVSLYLLYKGYWIVPLVLPLALFSGLLSLRPGLAAARRVLLILIAGGLAITLLVEFIVLDGDIGRMNTVFKFYMQVWIMFSIVGGIALVSTWDSLRSRPRIRRLWSAALALLIAAAALYPILATPAKWNVRMNPEAPKTLDSMAFMQVTSYNDVRFDGSGISIDLSHDYDAIRWLQENLEGSPVIAEAHGSNPYRSVASRVAMYTGLPTVVGWDWHQRQQRAVMPDFLVSNRILDVNTLYNTTDVQQALDILRKYAVDYIYAGQLEWNYYQPQGLIKFDEMVEQGFLEEIYRNGGVTIYQVLS